MPIYEYECTSCNVRFERQQSVHDAPVKDCPECAGTTRRVFHPVGIIFKGSGFYVTDNRKTSAASSSSSSTSKDGSEEKSSTSKSEAGESAAAKPAEPVATKSGTD